MQRITEEIDGIDVFTYDTDLFADAMKLSRPELYERAKGTNRKGISTLRKYDLAVIVADAETYRRDADRADEIDAQRSEQVGEGADTLGSLRAYLGTPSDAGLTWAEIKQGYLDAMAERDRIEHNQAARTADVPAELCAHGIDARYPCSICRDDEARRGHDMCLGDFGAYGACVLQRGHSSAKCRDAQGHEFVATEGTRRPAPGESRERCTKRLRAYNGSETQSICGLYVNADGVCPDVSHRPAWRRTFVMHTRSHQRYEVLGYDAKTGRLHLRHDCGTACSAANVAVSQAVLEWDYRAVCAHGYGPMDSCPLCDADADRREEAGSAQVTTNAKLIKVNLALIKDRTEAREQLGKHKMALMTVAARLRVVAEEIEAFMKESR